ncbi:MAG: 2-phospho-L-lactate transferase [Microbacteriaceae bacterium]|nr:2-phospho-L-lactate transferase [Microbacteriaceae bacterium]MCL2793772.1 2-phospho-L-lactate transferase [Microbacteriaceae bacterium]
MLQNIVVLAGGVGGARFTRGLVAELEARHPDPATRPDVTAVVNTGDDAWVAGLRITPDLDSMMYTLAGRNDEERGWGLRDESYRVSAELSAYGVGWPWFTLGDLDLGTHIARSAMLRDGLSHTQVVERLTARWNDGLGPPVRLLPMSDSPIETHVEIDLGSGPELVHFEEWWVKHRASVPAQRFVQVGLPGASATWQVRDALSAASLILIAPSNPVVSIGTILAVPGVRAAIDASGAPVVGVSPIIGGAVVRGMADACLTAIGVETSAAAVAAHYGARSAAFAGSGALRPGLLSGWLVGEEDAALVPGVEALGIRTRAVPLWMTDVAASAALAGTALDLGAQLAE